MLLESFHEEEVFPKSSGIISSSKWTEVVNNGIAKTDVAEIDFLAFFYFVVKIFGKRIAALDDEAFLQNVDIALDSLAVHPGFSGETFIRDFLPNPIGKQLYQMPETAGTANFLQGKYTAKQKIAA